MRRKSFAALASALGRTHSDGPSPCLKGVTSGLTFDDDDLKAHG